MADATTAGTDTAEVSCVLDARAELGECPLWAAEEQALYWVDIRAPALHRLHPDTGELRSWPMPSRIGSFGLRESGGAVVPLAAGFWLLDPATGRPKFIGGPPPAPPTPLDAGHV